jgi:hypothetical protein
MPACITGALLAVKWARRALQPQSMLTHLSGPRLLEGHEGETEAVRFAVRERGGAKVPGFIRLHPLLDLSKRTWCRHMLVSGSVGSGKTQIIWPIVQQIRQRRKKLFLLDVKGDYTSAIKNALILSPWDRRSVYLDIAADIRTSAAASAFASAMIPREDGSNSFFSTAAELILTGCLRALQKRAGTRWHWDDLDFLLNLSAAELAPAMADYYAKAHPLLKAGDSTAANIMASVSSYTQTISQLAEAFKSGQDEKGRPRKRLSLVAWAKDDYEGCPTIIAHAGPDTGLTQRYLAAVIDTVVPTIMQLPDDVTEDGRAIFFVLDELSTIGRVKNLASLIDKGRSKGCSVIVGVQDRAQLAATHGEHFARALPGMIGSHIVTQTQIGPTRQELAAMLGERRVVWTAPSPTKERTPIFRTPPWSRPVSTSLSITAKVWAMASRIASKMATRSSGMAAAKASETDFGAMLNVQSKPTRWPPRQVPFGKPCLLSTDCPDASSFGTHCAARPAVCDNASPVVGSKPCASRSIASASTRPSRPNSRAPPPSHREVCRTTGPCSAV